MSDLKRVLTLLHRIRVSGYIPADTTMMSEVIEACTLLEEPPEILSEATLRKLGALTLESERSRAVEDHLREQRETYSRHSRETLIEELVRRDENRLKEGRQMADGRMATNLLRELTRHLLHKADAAQLKQLTGAAKRGKPALLEALERGDGGIPGLVEGLLQELGADAADLRTLRLHGSLLGSGKSTEEVAAEFDQLVDGSLQHTEDGTAGSARVGDEVMEHQKAMKPGAVDSRITTAKEQE